MTRAHTIGPEQVEATLQYLSQLKLRSLPVISDADNNAVGTVKLGNLPEGIVSGGTMLAFAADVPAEVRGAVAMAALVAQRRANTLKVGKGSDAWIEAHLGVFQKLNWLLEQNAEAEHTVSEAGIGIHTAIIPFLTAALGPGGVAGSTIITSLQNLSDVDAKKRWFRLYDKNTRAVHMTEQFFGYVSIEDGSVVIRMAAIALDGKHCKRQILLFRTSRSDVTFRGRAIQMRAQPDMLTQLYGPLADKLENRAEDFLARIDIG